MTLSSTISSLLGLVPLDSNNTSTAPPADYDSSFLFRQVYVVCFIGIPLNLFVVYLSFVNKSIQNNYKYFLGNIAICDILFLYGLLMLDLVHTYVVENNLIYTPFLCTMYRIWGQTFCVCYFHSQPLVSINRYVVVVRQNDDFFTNRVVLILCMLVYWPILYPILAFACPTHLVRDVLCGYMYWFPLIREFMLVPAGILNCISVFCVVKLFLCIREHMKTVSAHLDMSSLKDERSLLIAITIQGILPILSCLPSVITDVMQGLFNNFDDLLEDWHLLGITIYHPFLNFSMGLFQLCPVIDPLVTLFCARQYRRVISNWCRRIIRRKSKNRVHPVIHVNS